MRLYFCIENGTNGSSGNNGDNGCGRSALDVSTGAFYEPTPDADTVVGIVLVFGEL